MVEYDETQAPWNKPIEGLSFNPKYETEFRKSQIKMPGLDGGQKLIFPVMCGLEEFLYQTDLYCALKMKKNF